MVKHIVSSLKELHKDYGNDGDTALVVEQNTSHIFPTPVIYTKIDGAWTPSEWYPINRFNPDAEEPIVPDPEPIEPEPVIPEPVEPEPVSTEI